MRPRSTVSGLLAILRKHVIVLVTAIVVVGTSGAFYSWRQPNVWRADAKLLVRRPMPSLSRSRDSARFFAIDRVGLNTEFLLLREDLVLAQKVVDRLREAGVDLKKGGYSAASLVSRVSVGEVAGTELVLFSLTGSDPETLPRAVNEYADVYREFAEQSRAAGYLAQRQEFEREQQAAREVLEAAERELNGLLAEHPDLNLPAGVNPASSRRQSGAARMPQVLAQRADDTSMLRRITETLERIGLRVEQSENEPRILSGGEASPVEQALAGDAFVAGLPQVRAQPEVARLRREEDGLRQRDENLAGGGRLEGHEDRVALRTDLERTERARGAIIARTLELEIRAITDRAEHTERQQDELAALELEEKRLNAIFAEYQRLSRDESTRRREYDDAVRRQKQFAEAFISSSDGEEGESTPRLRIEIRTPARHATLISPRSGLAVMLTVIAALSTGIGLVFLIEFLDDSIQSKDDFDRYLRLPFLGAVPRIPPGEDTNPDLAAEDSPGSAVAESFRTIRTSILLSRSDHPVKSMLITSAGAGEGKTTIATNLSATFARHRAPVLLVDADLRRPRIAKALDLPNERGLTDLLVGEATLDEVLQESCIEGLHVVTSGTIPPNPAELLHGDNMAAFLELAASRFERIVIDSPPLVAVTDARILASRVDGLYLVVQVGKTSRRLVQRALESLTSVGLAVHGAMLNGMTPRTARYGDYYYYERYGHTPK